MTELLKEIEEKIKFLLILKAKPLPPGTVRVWGEERYRKDKEGNYLVTIGKVNINREGNKIKKSVVRDGSCTRNTCSPEGNHPNTRLSASLTTAINISQNQEKSSPVVEKNEKKERKMDLLKSRSHKYVKRVPKTNGKGYRYFYAKDFKTPFRSLLNFFGIGKARIEKDYEGNHIEKDFGVSKSVFAQHVLHYFLNKAKWDKVFSGTKQKEQKKNSEGASSSGTEKKKPTEQEQKQKTDQPVYSKALMRRIYSIYNGSGQKDPDANEHDNRSRAMLGNENAKKLSSLTNEDKQKIRISLENVISSVRDGVIVAEEGKKIIESSKEWVEKNFTAPANTDIGEVFITKSGIANSLSHGFGKDKLKAIPSIKDVLEKGCYIGYEDDFGGKPLKNHYFAGRVQFPNGSKIVFCRVRESKTGGEKHFYVHEIFTDDVIKKGDSFKTGLSKNGEDPGGIPFYLSILQDIFGVNSNKENKFSNEHDNRSRAMLGNENAKKEFSSLSEGEKIEKGKAIKENIVCKIEKDSVPYNGDGMTERDYRIAKVHFDERTVASSTFKQKIVNAGSLDKAVEVLSQYSNGKSWIPIVCAYYDKNPQGGTVEIPSGKSASSYYIAAQQLESGSKPYWSTPHEMAARAFSAYVDDKLREKDRHNDYLAYKTSNRYYRGGEPYPSGDERKKINEAFDNLFRVVKETNAIRKALSGWLP